MQLKKRVYSIHSKPWKLVLFVLLSVIVFSLAKDLAKIAGFDTQLEDTQQKIEELSQEKQILERQLRYVQSDGYKEIQIRDKLGLAKDGEIVVVLPNEETLKKLSPRQSAVEDVYRADSNWEKWLEVFF